MDSTLIPLTKAETNSRILVTVFYTSTYKQIYSFQIKTFIVETWNYSFFAHGTCMLFFTEHMINFWCNAREHPGMYYYIVSFSAIKVTVNDYIVHLGLSFP